MGGGGSYSAKRGQAWTWGGRGLQTAKNVRTPFTDDPKRDKGGRTNSVQYRSYINVHSKQYKNLSLENLCGPQKDLERVRRLGVVLAPTHISYATSCSHSKCHHRTLPKKRPIYYLLGVSQPQVSQSLCTPGKRLYRIQLSTHMQKRAQGE